LLLTLEQAVHQRHEGTLLTMRATNRKTWMAFSKRVWIIKPIVHGVGQGKFPRAEQTLTINP
jgi:hypothetical protein